MDNAICPGQPGLDEAITKMVAAISAIIPGSAIYLHGSASQGDFKLGWSDIDILVLTPTRIAEPEANQLVGLRQTLLKAEPGNPYYRLFEGGMLSADALLNGAKEHVVYWGTSGERITETYYFDGLSLAGLLDCGVLLCGKDLRSQMVYPAYSQLRREVVRYLRVVREHGDSVDWLLDIARGIYTIRTGGVIAKTSAGTWALEQGLCPDADALARTIQIRKEPLKYEEEEKVLANDVIQRFADVLQSELDKPYWYHGSPFELVELAPGSTITRWCELAEAFSHKPQSLSYDSVGGTISHNGKASGFLYVVAEPITAGEDITPHPDTTMDDGVEWLTKKPLRLRRIGVTGKTLCNQATW